MARWLFRRDSEQSASLAGIRMKFSRCRFRLIRPPGYRVWDETVGNRELNRSGTLKGHSSSVQSVSFSPDGTKLASGSEDGTVLLWDLLPYTTPQKSSSDFDGDGTVGFSDFVQFAAQFGLSQGDEGYDARFDLDRNGAIGFSDFLIFARRFREKHLGSGMRICRVCEAKGVH